MGLWPVLVGIAKSATPRVFGGEQNGGPGTAVRTVPVDIQFVRGRHHISQQGFVGFRSSPRPTAYSHLICLGGRA
jgi:hypothetical protein